MKNITVKCLENHTIYLYNKIIQVLEGEYIAILNEETYEYIVTNKNGDKFSVGEYFDGDIILDDMIALVRK